MISLFLTMSFAASPSKIEAYAYQAAFLQATSCPSDIMVVQFTSGRQTCTATPRYVQEECFKDPKTRKVHCKKVYECRILFNCVGEK